MDNLVTTTVLKWHLENRPVMEDWDMVWVDEEGKGHGFDWQFKPSTNAEHALEVVDKFDAMNVKYFPGGVPEHKRWRVDLIIVKQREDGVFKSKSCATLAEAICSAALKSVEEDK